jgi:hypothetical protein
MSDSMPENHEFKSLATQIKEAELAVNEHRRLVFIHGERLIQNAQRQMTTPSNLLLAGGIGFLMSEFTKKRPSEFSESIEASHNADAADIKKHFMTALNVMNFLQTLYSTFQESTKNSEYK